MKALLILCFVVSIASADQVYRANDKLIIETDDGAELVREERNGKVVTTGTNEDGDVFEYKTEVQQRIEDMESDLYLETRDKDDDG